MLRRIAHTGLSKLSLFFPPDPVRARQGSSADQDARYSNKNKKLMASTKFGTDIGKKVRARARARLLCLARASRVPWAHGARRGARGDRALRGRCRGSAPAVPGGAGQPPYQTPPRVESGDTGALRWT